MMKMKEKYLYTKEILKVNQLVFSKEKVMQYQEVKSITVNFGSIPEEFQI